MGAQQVIAVNAVLDPGACADRCFVDALLRPSRVMAYTLAAQEAAEADIVIAPRLPASDAVNSRDRQTLIDEGERAALGVIAHRCPACLRLGARHSCASAPTREAA
jgi:hypothetical protein